MKQHTTNKQPAETRGKMVIYKNMPVFSEKGKMLEEGRIHMPVSADYLNWVTQGRGAATIGAIDCYDVVR